MFRNDYDPNNPKDDGIFLKDYHPTVDIPTSDEAAWMMYPQYRWMHNKMNICDAQGIKNYPDGIAPHEYPIFCKPIINLGGMSTGARILHSEEEWNNIFVPGYFMMPVLKDPEYSIDVALVRGVPHWHATMLEHKDSCGSFTMFERVSVPDSVWRIAETWIDNHFAGFTGIINLEIMDGVIVESHQRMGEQFVDLNGKGWIEAVIGLYENHVWEFEGSPEHAYSFPVRVPKANLQYRFASWAINEVRNTTSSVQVFTDNAKFIHYNDEHTHRLAIVNSFDLEVGQAAVQLLLENLRVVD